MLWSNREIFSILMGKDQISDRMIKGLDEQL